MSPRFVRVTSITAHSVRTFFPRSFVSVSLILSQKMSFLCIASPRSRPRRNLTSSIVAVRVPSFVVFTLHFAVLSKSMVPSVASVSKMRSFSYASSGSTIAVR